MRTSFAIPLFLAGVTAGVALVIACGSGPATSHADPADAGDDGGATGSCGACTVNGPIQVITADTDPKQLVSISMPLDPCGKGISVGYGPLVVTDVFGDDFGEVAVFAVPKSYACDVSKGRQLVTIGPPSSTYANRPSVSGARIKLAANEELCAVTACSQGPHTVTVNGFHPYN